MLLGQLDWRLRAAAARVAGDPVFDEAFVLQDLVRAPGYRRQFEEWAGDISGRYVGALAACAPYTGEEYPRLHAVARAIPRMQRPTGLVGSDLEIETVNFPVIWGQGRLLAGLLYDTPRTDLAAYAAAGLLLGAVSMLASLLPARRAARIAPVLALRRQ